MSIVKNYFNNTSPIALLVQGYVFFLFVAWILLSLPFSKQIEISLIDGLFISASAVSTTGLVSIDPGSSYTFFGQLIILLIIQVGGIGYMTFGSLILLALKAKMSKASLKSSLEMSRTDLALPNDFRTSDFVKKVIAFTLIAEAIGAAFLYVLFLNAGEESPLWSAIFHSISAFCTAGFSLMETSFQAYQSHIGINIVISVLSLLGGIGFIVMVDIWSVFKNKDSELHFTSKVILKVTLALLVFGTLFLGFADENLVNMAHKERWLIAFFQVMTASTTVGFNTYSMADFNLAVIFVLYFLMLFGASPSGTGGGLKSTTLAALIGIVRSTLKSRKKISLDSKELPLDKLQLATSSFIFAMLIIFVATTALLLSEPAPLAPIMFEVFSALGTVGLSMGLTSELTDIGKIIIIVMMFMGRVGVLTFGIFMSMREEDSEETEDDDLVL